MKRRSIERPVVILFVILTALVPIACDRQTAEVPAIPEMRAVKDDLGREVRLPEKVTRAVSLAPSITEMVFAAGAGDRLVGVTSYCDFPTAAKNIQKVGDTQSPNIEAIIAVRPEVILVSTASQLEAFVPVLEQQSIAIYVSNVQNLDDVPRTLIDFGSLFGTEDVAINQAITFNGMASFIRHQRHLPVREGRQEARKHSVRVFVQISTEPLFTVGKDSFINEVIEVAGGVSVTKHIQGGYPKLSKETALALDPEVIILSDSPDNRKPNDAMKNSSAVRSGRVYRVNADILSRPGPRLADALEQLATLFRQEPAGN